MSDDLRAYFKEHGWSIVMDDRPGQPLDPFNALDPFNVLVTRLLDAERVRLTFHNEYEDDPSEDRYFGCQHRNQHRSTWDCQRRANEWLTDYEATK